MEVHLVAKRNELANFLRYHLGPLGLELVLHTDPIEMVAELENLDPPITLFNVEDYPRHWKPLLQQLRAFRSRKEAVFVLLARSALAEEEAAKALHLEVNGIVTDDVMEKRGTERLVELLRRYEQLRDKRTFVRHLVTESDRVGLCFIHPRSLSIVTGEVTEISLKGLAFTPDQPERCADLAPGTDLRLCSLRAGDTIVSVDCRVMRSGRDLGIQFLTFEEGSHGVLGSYIQARPERALRTALQADRAAAAETSGAKDA